MLYIFSYFRFVEIKKLYKKNVIIQFIFVVPRNLVYLDLRFFRGATTSVVSNNNVML